MTDATSITLSSRPPTAFSEAISDNTEAPMPRKPVNSKRKSVATPRKRPSVPSSPSKHLTPLSRPTTAPKSTKKPNSSSKQFTPRSKPKTLHKLDTSIRKRKKSLVSRLQSASSAGAGSRSDTPHASSPTVDYLNKITMKADECVQEMKKGTTMVKFCKLGTKPHYRRFYLSESEQYFNWTSDVKDATVTRILIRDIRDIIHGQETLKFKGCQDFLDKVDVSFSIVYGYEDRTLDLVAESKKDYFIYTEGLRYLMNRAKVGGSSFGSRKKKREDSQFDGVTKEQRYILLDIFKKYDTHTSDEPRIHNRDLKNVCRDLGMDISHDELLEITQMLDPKDSGYIDFEDFLVNCIEEVLAETATFEETINAFRNLDVMGTGFIMKRDLRAILTNVAPMIHENEIDDMMNEVHAFKGYVDYVEFVMKMFEGTQIAVPKDRDSVPHSTAFKVGASQ